jgi:hypothetical protein
MPSRGQGLSALRRPRKVSRRQARAARAELAAGGLSHRDQRRVRSILRTWDTVAGRRKRELRHTALAVIGGVVAMAVVGAAFAFGPAIDAARGQGTRGTFTVGYQTCSSRTGCSWVGTFQSPGGEVVPDVAYGGRLPVGTQPGTSIPAIDPGGSHEVYALHGSHTWVFDLLLMVILGAAVAFTLWISPIGLGKGEMRRRPRAA